MFLIAGPDGEIQPRLLSSQVDLRIGLRCGDRLTIVSRRMWSRGLRHPAPVGIESRCSLQADQPNRLDLELRAVTASVGSTTT